MSLYKRWKFKDSALLSAEENKEIRDLLERKCSSLVTTVVQLYHTAPPDHSDWIYKDCGVLCLIQDCKRRKYFFRLYCLIRKTTIWVYEVHRNLEYICPTRFLSSFEGDECIFGFNFACTNEASAFNAMVFHRISNPDIAAEPPHGEKKEEKKKKLSKKIISQPIEPRHVFHVGFKNMDVMKLPPAEIESYFEKKNIHKKFLQETPKVVPSVIAPIQVFPKLTSNEQQNITPKSILKPTSFNSFQENGARNFTSVPNSPFLQRSNVTFHKTAPVMPTTKPLTVSFSVNSVYQGERNLPRSSPIIPNHQIEAKNNDTMSIDESLAILNGVSDFLKDVQDDVAISKTPDFQHEDHSLSVVTEDLKKTLTRRVQAIHSSDDDSSDDWDD